MRLFIRPVDTQFHRSGLPFDAGEDTEVGTFFPPFPRTIYGALRAEGMCRAGGSLAIGKGSFAPGNTETYGDAHKFGSLAIKGPILARLDAGGKLDHRLFFPFPLDLLAKKKTEKNKKETMVLLGPREGDFHESGSDDTGCDLTGIAVSFMDQQGLLEPWSGDHVECLNGDYFLPYPALNRYLTHRIEAALNDEKKHYASGKAENIFRTEARTGIGRDNFKRTARESMLYCIPHHRMFDSLHDTCGFYLHVEGHDDRLPGAGILQIGGDFRAASYTAVVDGDSKSWWENHKGDVEKMMLENGRFKAFFITPALFRRGCIPDAPGIRVAPSGKEESESVCIEIRTGDGSLVRFRLKGACIGKPRRVGGWSVQGRKPKGLRKAVPEGSVYFFEAEGWKGLSDAFKRDAVSCIFKDYNFQSWCSMDAWEDGTESGPGREGFGIALIGGW